VKLQNRIHKISGSLLTLGALLLSLPAAAINMGDIKLLSGYGQPLRATIPISIRENEILKPGCITQVQDGSDASLASINDIDIIVPSAGTAGVYEIVVTSTQPLTEPMYELRLRLNCTGASSFIRSFILMPEVKNDTSVLSSAVQRKPAEQKKPAPAATRSVSGPANNQAAPLSIGSEYIVKHGESASMIAARITPAWGSLKNRVNALVAENPDAFYNESPFSIKSGATLTIPGKAPVSAATQPEIQSEPETVLAAVAPPAPEAPAISASEEITEDPAAINPDEEPAIATVTTNDPGTGNNSTPEGSAPEGSRNTPGSGSGNGVSGSGTTASASSNTELEAAYAVARQAAAEAARPKTTPEVVVETAAEPSAASNSGSGNVLLAIIIGAIVGLVISILILAKRMIDSRKRLVEPTVDPDTLPRYANNTDEFVAPVSTESAEDSFVVNEDENEFMKTLGGDEHAAKTIAALSTERTAQETHDPLEDTADELPKPTVNSTFLDSNPDIFDATADASKVNAEDTVQDLFDEALFDDPEDPDAPAEERIQNAKNAHENVQRLAQTAEDEDDDELSKTLAEALHLLEQDYHEELTASQVLDKQSVSQSLGNGAAKRDH